MRKTLPLQEVYVLLTTYYIKTLQQLDKNSVKNSSSKSAHKVEVASNKNTRKM